MKYISLFIVVIFLSCKHETEKKSININQQQMLEKILIEQLEEGNSSDYPMDYTQKDFDIIIPILKQELKSSGFIVIDKNEFNKKIKLVFDRTIDVNSINKYLYVNLLEKCNRDMNWKLNNQVEYNGLFVVKNDCLISDFYALPQLIDYQKEYPNASKVEDKQIIIKDEIENNNVEIKRWKDDKDLSQKRMNFIQILTNRNKYLFNDNKASFLWLRFNDSKFLETLVKTFGYVQDGELNKFVLDKNLKDNEEFGKVIWNKDCSDKIDFHEEIIETIKKASKKDQEKYLESIDSYLIYLANTSNIELDLTFSEKAEISGKLAYFSTKAVGEESLDYFKFFPVVAGEEYQKEFEKQKYYNIKDFKEIYFETKTGGVSYPGMGE